MPPEVPLKNLACCIETLASCIGSVYIYIYYIYVYTYMDMSECIPREMEEVGRKEVRLVLFLMS